MRKLKTATGKAFDCDYFIPSDPMKQLNIYVHNTSLAEAVAVFSDPNETVQLWFGSQYAAHYTQVVRIEQEDDMVAVKLRKE